MTEDALVPVVVAGKLRTTDHPITCGKAALSTIPHVPLGAPPWCPLGRGRASCHHGNARMTERAD